MKLIVISDPVYFADEANLLNQLFDAGLAIFHLRKPAAERQACAALLNAIAEPYHNRIALHQFHDLVAEFPAIKRLHYPERIRNEQLKNNSLPAIGDGFTLSTSVHQLQAIDKLDRFDYTFYGPVFDSISKPGYVGLKDINLPFAGQKYATKIIALGGISAEKVTAIKQMNFDGLAVLGTLWNNKGQAIEKFRELNEKCR
uniref:thiamine phosphate synthase n=1 Tax=Pedobacter schmidteae TaxID=2201271 RepID=UPI000EAF6194|nr:thiamine phosphate synthase [Pedobacter schmidteae]